MQPPSPLHGPSGHAYHARHAAYLVSVAGAVWIVLAGLRVVPIPLWMAGLVGLLAFWAWRSTGGPRPRVCSARLVPPGVITAMALLGAAVAGPAPVAAVTGRLGIAASSATLMLVFVHLYALQRRRGWVEDRGGMHWIVGVAAVAYFGLILGFAQSVGCSRSGALQLALDITLMSTVMPLVVVAVLRVLGSFAQFPAPAPNRPIPEWTPGRSHLIAEHLE